MAVTLDSLKKAVKKNKGRSQALAWLADMERAAGNFDDALKLVDEALVASPSDVPAMLVRAKILVAMQDFAGSITEYKKVLSKDPFCLSAHKRMGESFDKLGKTVERNACFRRVHDMDPLDPFWKDEFDVLPEDQSDLVAPPMDDSSFTMNVDESDDANAEDDVFANLAASLPSSDEEDNTAMDALRNSLDFASDENAQNGEQLQDSDLDGHVLNSSEVSSAIAGILGGDDDLEEESNDSPFSHMEAPQQDDTPQSEEKVDENSLHDLFVNENSSENESHESADAPVEESPVEEASNSLFEKSADAEFSLDDSGKSNAEEQTTNVDDAFSSLLGDDELPEEKVEESQEESSEDNLSLGESEPASEVEDDNASETADLPSEESAESIGSLFEKSADAEFSLNDSSEESAEVEQTSSEQVSETPTNEIPSTHMDFSDAEDVVSIDDSELSLEGSDDLSLEKPALSGEVPSAHMDFSDAEDLLDEEPLDLTPAEEAPVEVANSEKKGISEDLSVSVDGAFDALFGDESEKLAETTDTAEEPTAEEPVASEETVAENDSVEEIQVDAEPAAKSLADELLENPLDDKALSLNDDVLDVPTETEKTGEADGTAQKTTADENLAKEMGGAFASMFGDEDELDLPEEKKEETAEDIPSQESTGAEIEEHLVKESDQINLDDDDLKLESVSDFINKESSEKAVEENLTSKPATADVPSAELDSIGSEVSNAFKGLFDEDDSLTESDEPSNKGVDYLMSGDSDDEVSASLVSDAAAPLSRGAADLDDSLNTRTLADIYMEQGVYNKALEIYSDLAKKNPDDAEIKSRLEEVQKLCHEKFGEN